MRSSISHAAIAGAVLLLLKASVGAAQNRKLVHIELVLHPSLTDEAQSDRLNVTRRTVQVRQNGIPLTLNIKDGEHLSVQSNLLVLETNPTGACADWIRDETTRHLLGPQWIVSFTDPSSSRLLTADTTRRTCEPRKANPSSFIAELAGRRAILVTNGIEQKLQSWVFTSPEVYRVDGGFISNHVTRPLVIPANGPSGFGDAPFEPYTLRCHEHGGFTVPNDPCFVGTQTTDHKNGYSAGIVHEKTMRDAFLAISKASKTYYDLTISGLALVSGSDFEVQFSDRNGVSGVIDAYVEERLADGSLARTPERLSVKVRQ